MIDIEFIIFYYFDDSSHYCFLVEILLHSVGNLNNFLARSKISSRCKQSRNSTPEKSTCVKTAHFCNVLKLETNLDTKVP